MKRSTGGLVFLARTSAKDGRRLRRPSSCASFPAYTLLSSSMFEGVATTRGGRGRGSEVGGNLCRIQATVAPSVSLSGQAEMAHHSHARVAISLSSPPSSSSPPSCTMSSLAKALSPSIREIRFLCCQKSPASAGVRHVSLHLNIVT